MRLLQNVEEERVEGRCPQCKFLATTSLPVRERRSGIPEYRTEAKAESGYVRDGTDRSVRWNDGGSCASFRWIFSSISVENQKQQRLLLANMLQILTEMLHRASRPSYQGPLRIQFAPSTSALCRADADFA